MALGEGKQKEQTSCEGSRNAKSFDCCAASTSWSGTALRRSERERESETLIINFLHFILTPILSERCIDFLLLRPHRGTKYQKGKGRDNTWKIGPCMKRTGYTKDGVYLPSWTGERLSLFCALYALSLSAHAQQKQTWWAARVELCAR